MRYGYDAVTAGRLWEGAHVREARALARYGAATPAYIYAGRILHDIAQIVRRRRGLGLRAREIPAFAAGVVALRLVELAGAFMALTRSEALVRRYDW